MIPKPFLDATTRNCTIEHGLAGQRSQMRPAKPGERVLGAFKLPPFQRGSVWTKQQQVRFIESIWLHLPIASYVVNVDWRTHLNYPCSDWLLDGQQRWTAIIDYTEHRFEVFGLFFGELDIAQQRKFKNHPFPSIETRDLTIEQCREVYERLAYGGTNHERDDKESP